MRPDLRPPMHPDMRPPVRPDMRPPCTAKTISDAKILYAAGTPMSAVTTVYEVALEMSDIARKGSKTTGELLLELTRNISIMEVPIAEHKSKQDQTILVFEYVIDFLLPPSRASDAMLDLEEVYDRRWLPKYGPRFARLIFASQAVGLIWSFHGQRLTKSVGAALGLVKLYGWLSGPRGG